jgi:hypothetical protein
VGRLFILVLFVSGFAVSQSAAEDSKPLTPVEAIKKVNEEVTVQMLVKTTKNRLEKRGEIYLDSEQDFHDENSLGVVVTKTGAAKFKEAGVDDPAVHFKDKTIRVKGTVIIKENHPRIEVDDPKQIQIVENEKKSDRTVIVPKDVKPFTVEKTDVVRLTGKGIAGSKIEIKVDGPAKVEATSTIKELNNGEPLIGGFTKEFDLKPTDAGKLTVTITVTSPQPDAKPKETKYEFEVK